MPVVAALEKIAPKSMEAAANVTVVKETSPGIFCSRIGDDRTSTTGLDNSEIVFAFKIKVVSSSDRMEDKTDVNSEA